MHYDYKQRVKTTSLGLTSSTKQRSDNQKTAPHTTKQKQNITEWNGYPNAAMKRNDKAAYVPRPEQVILEATAQRQT